MAATVAFVAGSQLYLVWALQHTPPGKNAASMSADGRAAAVASPAAPAPGAERAVLAELSAAERAPDPTGGARPGAIADLVVLISVDGLRPDVIPGHAETIRRMQLEGSFALHAETISKSSTLPSHASMVSGVDFPRHGIIFNAYRPERGRIQAPTIFSVAQDAELSTALFVGKLKLKLLLESEAESHFQVGGVKCSRVTTLALPYVRTAEPGIVFLHFSDPDSAGHQHGWMSAQYLEAVGRADRCVEQVIAALHKRGRLDRTLVVLTADHGGHDHDHHAPILPDTHIPWIAWGGAAKPVTRVNRQVYNTDTAATILRALGLPMPEHIEGKPVLEALAVPELAVAR